MPPYYRRIPPRDDFLLSVVIPVYNERDTLAEIVARVAAAPFRKEIVVVDDGSTDGTRETAQRLRDAGRIDRLLTHEDNRGKGAALHAAFREVQGHVVLVQDADLEYDPVEYPRLLEPILEGKADVVYGSRFLSGQAHRVLFFWHSVANRFLTLASNMFTNLNLTDMETCYKVFRREVVQALQLQEHRFGVEPEITAKIAKMRCRIYEVGITYDGRGYGEGKKIGWKDAVAALFCVVRYGLFGRPAVTVEDLDLRPPAPEESEAEANDGDSDSEANKQREHAALTG